MTTRNADTDAAIIVDEVLSFVFDLKSLQPLPMSLLIVSEVLHLNPEQCFFQCIPLTDDCVTEGCEWMKLAKHKPCITMSTMMPSASAATRYHAQCAQDLIELLGVDHAVAKLQEQLRGSVGVEQLGIIGQLRDIAFCSARS